MRLIHFQVCNFEIFVCKDNFGVEELCGVLCFVGATVSTRGRFMTEQEKQRCPNERPLYLFIQGHSKLNIDCM